MKRTSKMTVIAAAAIMALGLVSCGDTEESSSKSGTVSLVTTTTTAAPESSETETTTTTTTAETTATEETTTTTATEKETETETETTTTTAAEPETADKLAINYKGNKISVGESFADAESKLGTYSDHFTAAHCTDDGMDEVYEYEGMEVVVFEGKISHVMLYNVGDAPADPPYAECGLKVGMTDPQSILGEPVKANATDSKYEVDGKYVYVQMEDGKARVIMIAELEEAIPDFAE